MARELLPVTPADIRQQINSDMRDKGLGMLDDNARFIVRRMVGRAYARGHDDGWTAGQDDARTDRAIEQKREPHTPTQVTEGGTQ